MRRSRCCGRGTLTEFTPQEGLDVQVGTSICLTWAALIVPLLKNRGRIGALAVRVPSPPAGASPVTACARLLCAPSCSLSSSPFEACLWCRHTGTVSTRSVVFLARERPQCTEDQLQTLTCTADHEAKSSALRASGASKSCAWRVLGWLHSPHVQFEPGCQVIIPTNFWSLALSCLSIVWLTYGPSQPDFHA